MIRRIDVQNGVIIGLIIILVMSLPLYLGLVGSVLMAYMPPESSWTITQEYLAASGWAFKLDGFRTIHQWYWDNYQAFTPQAAAAYGLKLYGPIIFSVLLGLLFVFLMRAPLIDFRPFKPKESVHGDARWASELEIRKSKLREKKGFIVGTTGTAPGELLICDDFQHILLFAPTGSGKGVGFVIPNLLFWEHSAIVHDIKLENYELTSGYRKNKLGQEVYVWNPADPDGKTHCYNPIDWISEKPGQMVDDSQKICNLILPEQDFWVNEARSLLLGIILYLIAVPDKMKSFGEVVRTMRSDDVVYNLAVVLDTIGKKIHPVAYMNIAAFLQKADKERSGVISTMNSGLELWANPLIDTATSLSDFNIQEFKRKKITVYVGVTPDNLTRLRPLLQVFYQQATDFLTRKMPEETDHGVLFLMDEFPTLGEMEQFKNGIAYFRGYKVKLFLVVQDTQQLKGIYEEAGMNSFLSNSYYRITFSANNVETANLISQLVGNKTVEQQSHNKPRFLDLNPATRTIHASETQRALLLPQEVIGLPRDEQIILVESNPPIKTKKIFYFKEKFFKDRLLPQTEVPEQEPYDPRKKKKPKPKPKPAAPPPPPPPPPPPKDKPPAAGGKPPAAPPLAKPAAAAPPPQPAPQKEPIKEETKKVESKPAPPMEKPSASGGPSESKGKEPAPAKPQEKNPAGKAEGTALPTSSNSPASSDSKDKPASSGGGPSSPPPAGGAKLTTMPSSPEKENKPADKPSA